MRHCVTMAYFNQNVPNFQRLRFFSFFKGITYVRTCEESEIGENQLSLDNYVKGYKDIQKAGHSTSYRKGRQLYKSYKTHLTTIEGYEI